MPLTDEDKKIIFNKVKSALEKQTPPMVVCKDKEGVYELMGNKPDHSGNVFFFCCITQGFHQFLFF